jgi:hypothetical protein
VFTVRNCTDPGVDIVLRILLCRLTTRISDRACDRIREVRTETRETLVESKSYPRAAPWYLATFCVLSTSPQAELSSVVAKTKL